MKSTLKLSPEMRAQLREIFLDEAATLVDQLEAALLVLERNPKDVETINEAFRAAHTIKGSAAGAGFDGISTFTHDVEYALDALRSKRLELNSSGLVAILEAVDILRMFLTAARENSAEPDGQSCLQHLNQQFPRLVSVHQTQETLVSVNPVSQTRYWEPVMENFTGQQVQQLQDELISGGKFFHIRWILSEDAFNFGIDPLVLFRALGDEAIILGAQLILENLPILEDLDPFSCYLGIETIVASQVSEKDLLENFAFCPDGSTVNIVRCGLGEIRSLAEVLSLKPAFETGPFWKQVWEHISSADDSSIEDNSVGKARQVEPYSDESVSGSGSPSKQSLRADSLRGDDGRTIRVKQERLDGFMNLVGELVTARNTLLHLQKIVETEYELPDLARRMKSTTTVVNRTVSQLQTDVLSLRMVPLKTVFQRMPRIIRDVASRQYKQVDLQMSGEETEVDKTVADGLVDPLVHLVRNSVDHGIESSEDRRAAGKSDEGKIWLSAWQDGKGVVIEIRDDGAGIDPQRIRKAAIDKGFLDPIEAERLTDNEAINLIFSAGFSTNQEVTEFSGRGVGMDVVRSNVARMGGSVSVSSQAGQGTTIRLQVPLSLSLFRALLIHTGDETLALPLDAVQETVSVRPEDCLHMMGRPVVVIRGETVGLVSLAEAMGFPSRTKSSDQEKDDWSVVVVESSGERVGLLVDGLDSPQEIMVKPLEGYLTARGAVAGASVMGDGRVALVLDPAGLIQLTLDHARCKQS